MGFVWATGTTLAFGAGVLGLISSGAVALGGLIIIGYCLWTMPDHELEDNGYIGIVGGGGS
jgi:hypothetical protein